MGREIKIGKQMTEWPEDRVSITEIPITLA